jgi:hypothetical protein
MALLILAAKIAIVLSYLQIAHMMTCFQKQEPQMKIEFDLLSRLSICAVIGLSLVSLAAAITESTYLFTLLLCVLSIVCIQLQGRQIIVAGSEYVLLATHAVPIGEITKLEAGWYTLKVTTRKKAYRVYVPLTTRETLQDRVYQKIQK